MVKYEKYYILLGGLSMKKKVLFVSLIAACTICGLHTSPAYAQSLEQKENNMQNISYQQSVSDSEEKTNFETKVKQMLKEQNKITDLDAVKLIYYNNKVMKKSLDYNYFYDEKGQNLLIIDNELKLVKEIYLEYPTDKIYVLNNKALIDPIFGHITILNEDLTYKSYRNAGFFFRFGDEIFLENNENEILVIQGYDTTGGLVTKIQFDDKEGKCYPQIFNPENFVDLDYIQINGDIYFSLLDNDSVKIKKYENLKFTTLYEVPKELVKIGGKPNSSIKSPLFSRNKDVLSLQGKDGNDLVLDDEFKVSNPIEEDVSVYPFYEEHY